MTRSHPLTKRQNVNTLSNNNRPTKNIDYLIVGQGLAGTLLAHQLLKRNKTVMLVDQGHELSSSKLAAGIVNPITGRRFLKSWMFEMFFPYAKSFYQKIENLFSQQFFYEQPILKALHTVREENDWLSKSASIQCQDYLKDLSQQNSFTGKVNEVLAVGELGQTAQVDVGKLITKFRAYFQNENLLLEEAFDFDELKFEAGEELVYYKNITAQKVIFCEGFQCIYNPYFHYLPFELAKGEVLLVKIPDANFTEIYKDKVYIIPLPNGLHWVGATYDWEYESTNPTAAGKSQLLEKLKSVLQIPFELVDQIAAIRPTVMDRRPLLGIHPDHPQLAVFNGFGSKGTSMIPYWSNEFVNLLLENKPLIEEVDIQRFHGWHVKEFPIHETHFGKYIK